MDVDAFWRPLAAAAAAPAARGGGGLTLSAIARGWRLGCGVSTQLIGNDEVPRKEVPVVMSATGSRGVSRPDPSRTTPTTASSISLVHSLALTERSPRFWRARASCTLWTALPSLPASAVPRLPLPPRLLRAGRGKVLHVSDGASSASSDGERSGGGGRLDRMRTENALAASTRTSRAVATSASLEAQPASAAAAAVARAFKASRVGFRTRVALASAALPSYEQEALGGANSIRGYGDGELGVGALQCSGGVELNVPLNAGAGNAARPVSMVLFADAGGVGSGGGRSASAELAEGVPSAVARGTAVGASLGYGLRLGPIRMDVAYNVLGDRKVHVGLNAE